MFELADSIAKRGVSIPTIVRPKPNGGYEMIAGHRRKLGCILADKEVLPCIVRQMSDDEAVLIMADTNLRQRERLLPSEKAFAYRMKYESIKRQGERSDLTSGPVVQKLNSLEKLSEEFNENAKQIQRYIRLTYLTQPIIDMVDDNLIALRPAVEISYLSESNQQYLLDYMQINECTPSHAQTIKLHKLENESGLNATTINEIMSEEKPNQVEKIKIPKKRIMSFFNRDMSNKEIEDEIVRALEVYHRMRNKKRSDRDAR